MSAGYPREFPRDAEEGRRSGLGQADGIGPQVLVVEEALDALGVTGEGAQVHASPAMKAGVDGQTEGQAHEPPTFCTPRVSFAAHRTLEDHQRRASSAEQQVL